MAHRAEEVMAAIELLVTGLTTTGANIERGRVYPWADAQLPAISLYMGADSPINNEQRNMGFYDWQLEIKVVAMCKKTESSGIETTLNLIRSEFTTAIMVDHTLGESFVIDVIEIGSESPEISGEAEKPAATQQTNFIVNYRRSIGDPRQ